MSTNRQVIGYENVALFQSNTGAYATGSNSETGMVFIGNAQSLDFSFSVNREDVEGLGSRGLVSTQNTTAVDVDLTINTLEDFSGLFNRSFLSGQSRSGDTNIYAVIGLDKSKDIVRQNLSGQDVLCFGNCFLQNLSMNQTVGGIMSSNYQFVASNVEVNKIEPRAIYTNDFENVTGFNGEDLTVTEADFDVSIQQIGASSPKNISSIGAGTRGNMAELFPLNFNETLKIRDFLGGDLFITGTDRDAYAGVGIEGRPNVQNPALDGHIHGNKSLMFGEEKNGYGYAVAITDFPKTGRYIIEGGVRVFPDNQIALQLHPFNVLTGYQASLFTDQGGLNTSTKRNAASQVSTGLLIERHTSETFDGDHGRFKRFHNEFEINNTITGGLILVAKDLNQDLGVDIPASRDHFVYLSDLTIKHVDEFQVRAPAIDLSGSQEQNTTGYFSGIGNYTGHLNYYKGNQTSVSIKRKANKNVLFEDDFSNGNIENVPILKNTSSGINHFLDFTNNISSPDAGTRAITSDVLKFTFTPSDLTSSYGARGVFTRFGKGAYEQSTNNAFISGKNYLLTGQFRVSEPGDLGNAVARVDVSDFDFEAETQSTTFVPFNIQITGFPKHPKTNLHAFDIGIATSDVNFGATTNQGVCSAEFKDIKLFEVDNFGEDTFLIKPDNIQSLSLGLPVNRRTVYSLGKQYPVLRKSLGTNIGSLDLSVLNADFSHDENKDFYENGKEDLSTNLNEFLSRNNDYDITISGSGTALAGETYVNRVSNGFIRHVNHIPSYFGTFTAGDRFDGVHVNISFANLSKTVISTDEEAIEASSYLGSDVANFTKDIPKKNGNKNEAIRFKPTNDNITPQLALFNNHEDSTVSSTYLDRKHGIVEIIYFIPSASPLVGNYIHIGAANTKDPGEGGIVDKKDIYSRKGAKIVGGAWTKARVSFGSRYGGRDKPGDGTSAGGNNRFITFFTTELIDDTTDFVRVDINDSWYLAEYVLLDTFDPIQFNFQLPSSKLNSETFNSAIGRLSTSNINFSFDRNLITYNN